MSDTRADHPTSRITAPSIRAILSQHDYRVTKPREQIIDLALRHDRPFTAEQIVEWANRRTSDGGRIRYHHLAAIMVVNSVVSVFYYLAVARQMIGAESEIKNNPQVIFLGLHGEGGKTTAAGSARGRTPSPTAPSSKGGAYAPTSSGGTSTTASRT